MSTDVRSLPDTTLNLYLYGIGAWGIGLALLALSRHTALALPMLYFVAIWQIGITVWWAPNTIRRFEAGEFTRAEAEQGVLSVARLLAASSLLPAIVFMASDPLSSDNWKAVGSIVAVGVALYVGSSVVVKLENRVVDLLILVLAGLALPLNITGGVWFGTAIGFFDRFLV